MWFTPKDMKLVESADGSSMLFDTATMQVLTESMYQNNVRSNEYAEAFAEHFTQNYDAFADENPVLKELKRLGKLTAVVKWIKDNNIPFDLSYFANYTPEVHATPQSTPQTSVPTGWWYGGSIRMLTFTGGVLYALDASNFSSTTGSSAATAGDAAVSSRPSEESFSWDFSANGQAYTAIAQSFTRSQKDGSVRGSTTDMAFPVTGDVPLAFVRYYDSFYDNSTGFGYGWQVTPFALRFPDDVRPFTFGSNALTVSAHYQVYVRAGQGEFLYALSRLDTNSKAVYIREGGSDVLTDKQDGTYVLDMRNNGKVSFDSTGRVTRITDKNGIAITYNYSANGLASIVHQGGRTITLNYTSGKITSVTGPGSKTVAYAYDGNGQLNTVTDELNHTTTYYYDADKRINKIDDPKGNHAYQAAYDDYNRATSQTMGGANYASEFDLASRTTLLTDPNNTTSTQIFDEDYKLSQSEDFLNNKVNIEYDPSGWGPSKVTDAQGNVTQYKSDSNGNVWYARDAQGHQTFLFYDSRNNLIAKRDAKGYDMAFIYDANDRLVETRLIVQLSYITPADPVDPPGNLSYSYDPNYVIKYSYDSGTGKLLSVTDAQGRTVVTTYDVNGLPVTITAPGGYKTINTYDDRSRLTSVTNLAGETTTFEYDAADRIKKVTTANGTAIASSVQYTYDNNGNVATITDGKAYVTQYGYDSNNNLTMVTDAENGVTIYTYDITNKLTSIVLANGATKEIAYDESNRPIMEINRRANPRPRIVAPQSSINFGSVAAGVPVPKQFTVYNVGDAALNITNVSSNNSVFTVSPQSGTVAAGGSLVFNVTFTSPAVGASTGKLTIASNDTRSPSIDINLSGDATLGTLSGRVTSELGGLRVQWNQYQGQGTFAQYKVYRSTSAITDLSALTFIWTTTSVGTLSYLDATTAIGAGYYYAVAAFDAGGNRLTGIESIGPVNFLNIGRLGGAINAAVSTNNENVLAQVYNSTTQEYFLVYEKDVSGGGTNMDIYGQRVSAGGALVGGAFAIFSSGNNEKTPQVAWNSSTNEYMVVCAYDSNGSGLYQVRAQRVSASGGLLGATSTIYSSSKAQITPTIIYNLTENKYLVAFMSDGSGDGKDDLYYFILNADGSWSVGKTQPWAGYVLKNPHAAYNSQANEYLVVSEWTDNASLSRVAVFRIKNDGTILVGTSIILTKKAYVPKVAYNPVRNEYVVVVQYDYLGAGASYALLALKVDAAVSGTSWAYFSATGNSLLLPTIAYFPTKGEYFITFTNLATSTGEYDVQTFRILASTLAQVTTQAMGVSAESGKQERNSVVAFNAASNEFLVSYEYNNGSNYDIRSQRVGAVTQTARFTPASFDFGTTTAPQTLQMDGIAGAPFSSFSPSQDQPWIGISFTALSLSGANPYVTMRISINRTGLGVGTYTGNVVIRCDGITTLIPVTMQVTNLAPNVPTNPTPVTGATGQAILGSPLRVATTWQGSDPQGDALTYDVYLSDNQTLVTNADSSVLVASSQAAAFYTSSALGHNRTYYWRVKARDPGGLTALGDVWQFGTEGIATPVLIAQNPDPTNVQKPILRWGDVDGAARYHVQIANNANFTSPLVDVSNVTTAAYTPASNLPEGTIFWRVSAIDDQGGEGSFSATSSFVIDMTPPAKVTLTAYTPDPTTTKKPVLSWTAVSDASFYHIQISTAADFASTLFDGFVSATSYTPVTDLPDGRIYWHVSAKDATGNEGAYSDANNFSVDTTPPAQVALATPVAGFTNIQLSWTAIVDTQVDFKNFNIYCSETAFSNITGMTPIDQLLTNKLATSFTDTTAVISKSYYYAVTAVDLLGNENKQVIAKGPVSLAKAPALLMATSGDTQVLLEWEAVAGATSYAIKYGTVAGVYGAPVVVGNVTSYTVTGLTNAMPYYFVVTVTTSAGTSGNSNEMNATPQLAPPAAPALNSAVAGTTQVALSWGSVSGATSYSVKYGTATGVYGAPVSVGDVTSYTVTGLTDGAPYYFVVTAVNAAGTSPISNEKSATSLAAPVLNTATAGDAQVALTWGSASGATGYSIKYGTATGVYGTPVVVGNVTSYTVTGLTNGTPYYFVITATNASGTGLNSNEKTASPLAIPVAPVLNTATAGDAQVALTWGAVTGAASYSIKYGTATGVYGAPVVVGSATNYTVTGMANGTTYYFVVTAANASGTGPNSNEKFAAPLAIPVAPVLNTATAGDAQVTLSWGGVTGATSYSIKYGTATGVYGTPVVVGNVTSYTVTGLTNGTPYYFVVTASNASGTGANSNEKSESPLAIPVAPVLNTATAGDAQVMLSWSAATGATSYSVKYGTAMGVYGAPVSAGTATTYTVPGLTNGTPYYFVVTATNASGTGSNSNEKAVIPKKSIALVEYTPDPTNNQKPVLSWLFVLGAATYHVQISISNVFGTTLVDQYVAVTNYTPATNLPEGLIYWRVSVKDTLGNEEAFSAADSFRIDIAPPGVITLTAMDGRFQDVKITWQAFVDTQGDFKNFNIYRSASSFSNVSSMTPINQSLTDKTVTSFVDTAAVVGQKYYYAVTAVDVLGNENKQVVAMGPVGRAQAPTLNTTPAITNVNSIVLSGNKSAYTSILVNNVEVVPIGLGETWSVNYTLSEGANTLVVKARDSVGTESSLVTRNVQLDTQAPVIAITSPVSNSGISGTTVDVSGTIDDPAATVEIEVTGAATHTFPATNKGDGTFLATGVSIEGGGQRNTIKAKATDTASNTSENSVTVMQGWMIHMDVPYAAVTTNYSGAASTQMVLNYIRNGLKENLTQQQIYTYGHQYNLTANTVLLEMDPKAISYALGHFDPYDLTDPTGMGDSYAAYNFGVESFESTKFTEYLRDIMHWMAYPVKQGKWWESGPLTKWPNVPAVVPVYGTYGHWVVVNGAAASGNPMPEPYTNPWNTPNFTAYGLWLTDPATGGIGKDLYVTAQSAQDTFFFPVTTTDQYNGKYLQVAEPPNVESKAQVELAPAKVNEQTQELVHISGEIAQDVPDNLSEIQKRQENARKHLYDAALVVNLNMEEALDKKELPADKKSLSVVFKLNQSQSALDWRKVIDSSLFANEDFVKAFDGSQVREFIKVKRGDQESSFYYLVPFDKYVKGQFLTYAAVILDAQDGSFKEATWVEEPVRFIQITSERALELVSAEDAELKVADVVIELVWQPGGYSQSPFYPYWKVVTGDKTYFVTQDGKVIKNEKN